MLVQHDKHREILAAIIDSSNDAIISKGLDGVILSWNKAAERLFGYTESEAVGQHIFIIIPEYLRSEEEIIITKLKRGKRIEHFKTERRRKDGTLVPISLTISPLIDAQGNIIGASKIARDITKEKEVDLLIRQYVHSLEVINKVAKKISSKLDYQSILQIVTDAAVETTGAAFGAFFANKTDFLGQSYMLYTLSGVPREAFEKFPMPRNTAIFSKTFQGEGILRSDNITKDPRYGKNAPYSGMPSGHLPVVSYLAVPVRSPKGIVIGGLFLGHPKEAVFKEEHERIVSAIATQAAIALDNSELYENVQHLSSKKDEFVVIARHELRTPLTTLSGYLEIAEQSPEMVPDCLPKMKKQVKRLDQMIAELLDLSRVRAGNLSFKIEECSLRKLIQDSIDFVSPKDHKVHVELPVEDMVVAVDANKIIQVLVNLISNAVKYSNPGSSINICGTLLGDRIHISVKDTGEGIPPEHLSKIFDLFYRISKSKNKVEGMGLGLFICKEIMDLHSGEIWVESVIGKGSTFHIRFPISTN